jgi:hypothetical protein
MPSRLLARLRLDAEVEPALLGSGELGLDAAGIAAAAMKALAATHV